jgi:hypothetical protein
MFGITTSAILLPDYLNEKYEWVDKNKENEERNHCALHPNEMNYYSITANQV